MARFFVTQDGPYEYLPYSRGGSYRVWDELMPDPIREIQWYESHGAPVNDGGITLSHEEAREQAYSVMNSLNGRIEFAETYRRRK